MYAKINSVFKNIIIYKKTKYQLCSRYYEGKRLEINFQTTHWYNINGVISPGAISPGAISLE